MLSSKLLSLLQTFSGYGRNRFRKFLESPFFNEKAELTALFDIVEPFLGSENLLEEEQLKKKVVWKKLFRKSAYDDAKLRRLCSELTYQAYDFLYVSSCQSAEGPKLLHLMDALAGPGLEKHYRGVVRQYESLQQKRRVKEEGAYLQDFRFERLQHRQQEQQFQRAGQLLELERADQQLDCYYTLQKLKHYSDVLGYEKFLSISSGLKPEPGFCESVMASPLAEEPLIRAYCLVVQMLARPEEEPHYRVLKALLFESHQLFADSSLRELATYLKNYCIDIKINRGQSDYFYELFDLNEFSLRQGLLLQDGSLNAQAYKNIITVGLHIGKFKWVEGFIQDYTDKLPEGKQENALAYNLAKVYFHQGDYEKVIEQLREVEYQNLVYALGSKLMLLKTYYELSEFLALDSLVESFRIYLHRKREISRDVRQQYRNVLRFTRKLSHISPGDKQAVAKIRKQVEACDALAAKKWILEKVEELG